ncbi:MAG: transglutaminase domain-containing protein, partial [Planctomycetes bacterium]|nr:transglutaminase domain-containing protein [Planctomycetota bacterium]
PIGRVELSPIGEEHLPAGISEDQLLLRAFTYDSFDGTRWSNSGVPQFKNVALGADMSALSGAAQLTQDPEALVSVTYYDPQTARPFVLAFPHAVESVTSITDSSGIAIDMTLAYDTVSGLLQARPIGEDVPPAAVEARCRIPMRRITGRSRPAANPGDLARLTALPSGFKEALDAGWKEAGRFKRDSSPQRLATDLEDWFSRSGGFTYSLQQRPSGPDAIVRFICDEAQRSGHCEYFATAMVLVLRYLGVPARMCAGYAPEKAPDEKLQWEIKECNAHAWVEVWFADSGWRVYDPTAAGYHNPSSQPPNIDAANTPPPGKKPDARSTPGAVLEGKDPVKDFSDDVRDAFAAIFTGALATLVETLESGRDAIFTLLPEVLTPREGWARTLMLAVILALLAAPFVFRLRRTLEVRERVRAGLSGKNGMKLHQQSDLYRELLTVLARHGYSREATQTPEEFARHVVKGGGASFEAVLEATDVFYRLRYGSHSDDDMTRYRRLLKVLAATKT